MSIQGVKAGIRRKTLVGFKHPSEKGIIYAASPMHVKKKKPVPAPPPEPTPEPVVLEAIVPPKPEVKKTKVKSQIPYGLKELSDKPEA